MLEFYMTPGSCSAGIHIVLYALGRFSIVDAAPLRGDGDVENPGRQMQMRPAEKTLMALLYDEVKHQPGNSGTKPPKT